jgi:hypothetical protein
VSPCVPAEGRCAGDVEARGTKAGRVPGADNHRLDLRAAVVTEQISAVQVWERAVPDDVAADDRAVATAVWGDEERGYRVGGVTRLVRSISLPDAPAVVGSRAGAGRDEVDLLLEILAGVADEQVAGRAIEGEPPWAAEPVSPDLRPLARLSDERIGGRDRVAAAGGAVDAQDLGEQRVRVLPIVVRVVLAAAVAHADVELAFGSERELSSVVV